MHRDSEVIRFNDTEHRLYQGLCLEYLGRHQEAADEYGKWALNQTGDHLRYFPALWLRMVAIYSSAGRIDDLWEKVAQLEDDEMRQLFATAITIQKEAKRGDWEALVDRLNVDSQADPDSLGRRRHWEASEAAQLLAAFPEQSVPLLIRRLEIDETPPPPERIWVWHTLGLAGTPEAITALAQASLRGLSFRFRWALESALWQSGEEGRRVFRERFGPQAVANHQIMGEQEQEWDRVHEPRFPVLPKQIDWVE